jgi:multidrug efflux system membrane fusion protein
MQTVKTGVEDSGMTAVEGIQPGDVVATSSFNKLQNNSKVALSKQPAPPGTRGSTSP